MKPTAQVKRAKTVPGLEICVLEAQGDIYDETLGTPTNSAETSGENATDDDVVAPEVTEERYRLKMLGRMYRVPSDQLMPLRFVQKTNEPLHERMVGRTRARQVVLAGCAVRDPQNCFASWHQDGSRQVR